MENHVALRGYYVVAYTTRESSTLIKLDKGLSEVYKSNFDKELKGKNFEEVMFLKDKMFLIASALNKKTNVLEIFGTELDKNTGEMKGDWKPVFQLDRESSKDKLNYVITYNQDSSNIVIVTSVEYPDKATYSLTQYDVDLKRTVNPINIDYPMDPKMFDVQNLIYTPKGNLLMVNRVNEYQTGKKQKDKFIQFKEYDIKLYGPEGQLIKQVTNEPMPGKYLVQNSAKLLQDGNYAVASFYTLKRKSKEIDGMVFMKINGQTGEVMSQGSQELSNAMLTTVPDEEEDEEETKAERKERKRLESLQADEGGISKTYQIRDILAMADGGLTVIGEQFYTYTTYTTTGSGASMRTQTVVHDVYGNLLFIKVSPTSTVEWMHMLPKEQDMAIAGNSSGLGISYFHYRRPATYLSYGSMIQPGTNNLLMFFLDNPKNSKILNAGQKPKRMIRINKANCDMLVLDLNTGSYKRQTLFNNEDNTDAMPSLGGQFGKEYYICLLYTSPSPRD